MAGEPAVLQPKLTAAFSTSANDRQSSCLKGVHNIVKDGVQILLIDYLLSKNEQDTSHSRFSNHSILAGYLILVSKNLVWFATCLCLCSSMKLRPGLTACTSVQPIILYIGSSGLVAVWVQNPQP